MRGTVSQLEKYYNIAVRTNMVSQHTVSELSSSTELFFRLDQNSTGEGRGLKKNILQVWEQSSSDVCNAWQSPLTFFCYNDFSLVGWRVVYTNTIHKIRRFKNQFESQWMVWDLELAQGFVLSVHMPAMELKLVATKFPSNFPWHAKQTPPVYYGCCIRSP